MIIHVIILNRCGNTECGSAKRAFFAIENNIEAVFLLIGYTPNMHLMVCERWIPA